MFTIAQEPFGDFTLYKLLNEETGEYAAILPAFGATIHRLALMADSGELVEVLDGYDTADQMREEMARSYKGPVLFPFPNRVRQGKFVFENQSYQLGINEQSLRHALHGHLYNAEFEVVAQGASATGAFLILEYVSDGKTEGFPFEYGLNLDFRLNDEEFSCKVVMQNMGEKEIPVGAGYHPYFKLGGPIDQMLLKMPIQSQLELDDRLIPTGQESVPEKYREFSPIEQDHLDCCYHLDEEDTLAATQLFDPNKNVKLVVWQHTGPRQFNYLQVFTSLSRESIAIEPMTCAPDALNNGKGLILLKPDDMVEATFGVRVE